MEIRKAKVKVGMVFSYSQPGFSNRKPVKYKITRIEGNVAYHEGKGAFVYLDKNGEATFDSSWKWEEESRECKCGIFRGDCTYHKDK